VFLETTKEFAFFFGSLEATISEFARSIDELEGDLLANGVSALVEKSLSKSENPLSGSSSSTLDHNEVFTNHSVMMEATHGVDGFLGHIELSRSTLAVRSFSESVDLLVDVSSVEVTSLTSTGNGVLDSARMPSSNTSDLSETLVSFSGESGNTPTFDDTFKTVSLGNSDNVDHFVLVEDGVDINGFLEEILGEVNFLSDRATVDLDFHQVSFLLPLSEFSDLGVGQNSDDGTVLLDLSEIGIDSLVLVLRKVFQGILSESLLLGLVPVLVEASSNVVAQMLGPDGFKVSNTERSFDVTNNSDRDHGRSFEDGNGLDNFLLM